MRGFGPRRKPGKSDLSNEQRVRALLTNINKPAKLRKLPPGLKNKILAVSKSARQLESEIKILQEQIPAVPKENADKRGYLEDRIKQKRSQIGWLLTELEKSVKAHREQKRDEQRLRQSQ